ncbi:Rds1 protein [Umbelopsis sp. PMI_123]|nr:Rds1 protein [Umbelopsis sp. PMI_123]
MAFNDSGYEFSAPSPYNSSGELQNPLVAPYTPSGGLNTNGSIPIYHPLSDFDYESLNLVVHQEYIELDLFEYGLSTFSVKDFQDAGLNQEDRDLIQFMADQEVGHAEMVSNMLGKGAPKRCQYQYPFTNVSEFVDFCQKLTRFGESGVYGFLEHLNSRDAAQMLLQSITTEARQQMIFRQFEGLFPMPVWFETGITQSMAWTLLSRYIKSCPEGNPRIVFQNFPWLNVTNNPSGINGSYHPAITHDRPRLSYPGMELNFTWGNIGEKVGPNNSYITNSTAGAPMYAAWISQLNTTYTPLYDIRNNSARTRQPNITTYEGDPAVNGTMFVLITDNDLFVTPANVSKLNSHVVAGPALFQAG